MQESIRIRQILQLCQPETVIADIGADHGYTSAALLEAGLAEKVIATDISEHSLKKAKSLFAEKRFGIRAECRIGDGINVLRPGEAQGIIISGMGGHLILRILRACPETVQQCKWLVISPQSNVDIVRRELQNMQLRIIWEDVVWEDKKYYSLLKLQPGKPESYTEAELYTGKENLTVDRKRFLHHMQYLAQRQEQILQKASSSRNAATIAELLEIYRSAGEKGERT